MISAPPIAFMPDGRPAPYLMTEEELIVFARLDLLGIKRPDETLRRYRDQGLLRATQVGRAVRFKLPDVLAFLDRLQKENPR